MIDEKVLIERLEEEINDAKNLWDDDEYYIGQANAYEHTIEIVNQLAEESKVLEKQIAKKPILDKVYICPTCKSEMYCEPDYIQLHFNYCTECGQKLDWE